MNEGMNDVLWPVDIHGPTGRIMQKCAQKLKLQNNKQPERITKNCEFRWNGKSSYMMSNLVRNTNFFLKSTYLCQSYWLKDDWNTWNALVQHPRCRLIYACDCLILSFLMVFGNISEDIFTIISCCVVFSTQINWRSW